MGTNICIFHMSMNLKLLIHTKMILLTGQKLRKGGNDFPSCVSDISRLQITSKNIALISYLHLNSYSSDMRIFQILYTNH